MPNLCGCGCGAEVRRKYLPGHSKRVEFAGRRVYKPCLCGCGEYTVYRFAQGHASRINKSRDPHGNKRCPQCEQWKPFTSEFFPNSGKRGLSPICKPCHVAVGRRNELKRREDPEYFEKQRALWRRQQQFARLKNPKRQQDIKWRSALKLRAEMVAAYGGKCSCCGETELVFLTLEHINGDGAYHRELLRTLGGYKVWADLRRRGWPKDGFTILCWNCHMATCHGRPCPHKSVT
jgi:hypothetical protein